MARSCGVEKRRGGPRGTKSEKHYTTETGLRKRMGIRTNLSLDRARVSALFLPGKMLLRVVVAVQSNFC